MRTRLANHHREAHGRNLRVVEWIAPAGTDPTTIPDLVQARIDGLRLHGMDGVQHGFVNTSRRPDGRLYVSLHLYIDSCERTQGCHGGHDGVSVKAAPELSDGDLRQLVSAIGEDVNTLGDDEQQNAMALQALGFTAEDAPFRSGALGMTDAELATLRETAGDQVADALGQGDHRAAAGLLGLPPETHPFQALGHALHPNPADDQEEAVDAAS